MARVLAHITFKKESLLASFPFTQLHFTNDAGTLQRFGERDFSNSKCRLPECLKWNNWERPPGRVPGKSSETSRGDIEKRSSDSDGSAENSRWKLSGFDLGK